MGKITSPRHHDPADHDVAVMFFFPYNNRPAALYRRGPQELLHSISSLYELILRSNSTSEPFDILPSTFYFPPRDRRSPPAPQQGLRSLARPQRTVTSPQILKTTNRGPRCGWTIPRSCLSEVSEQVDQGISTSSTLRRCPRGSRQVCSLNYPETRTHPQILKTAMQLIAPPKTPPDPQDRDAADSSPENSPRSSRPRCS